MAKDIAHSIRSRLLKIARTTGKFNQDLLINYAMERCLYRLSLSEYADKMVLKGALMLHVLDENFSRATRDMDFIAYFSNTKDKIKKIFKSIMSTEVIDDGLKFDVDDIDVNLTQLDSKEMGAKVTFWAFLGTARLRMQADIGFGYKVVPGPYWINYPTLLGDKNPKILGYTPESIIADKFESMVSRELENSRMKDFYDVWLLATSKSFDNETLKAAIVETFNYFESKLPEGIPICFTKDFYENSLRQKQWKAFVKTSNIKESVSLSEAITVCALLLMPLCNELNDKAFSKKIWNYQAQKWDLL